MATGIAPRGGVATIIADVRFAAGYRTPAFLTPDAMDAWLDPVKLDRGGREDVLATLDGSSMAIAATIEQYVVDRKVNNSRSVDTEEPTVIQRIA